MSLTEKPPQRSRLWVAAIPVIVFAGLALLFWKGLSGNPSEIPSALIGKPVPEFNFPAIKDLGPPGFDTARLKTGQVTLVNVWASWCGPCRIEHPMLMELSKRSDIRLFGLNYKDEPANALPLPRHAWPTLCCGGCRQGRPRRRRLGRLWRARDLRHRWPGVIRYKFIGPLSPEAITSVLNPQIEKAQRSAGGHRLMSLTLNRRADLTLEACKRVAWGGEAVQLGETARAAIVRARADFLKLIAREDITIYGVNTGYGHQAKKRLTPEERKLQARTPTHHRAASWGDPLPERVTRAIVFARLANIIEGHAALSPHVADAVAAMLDGGPLPIVPARGQGGAGEILSLSHLFLDLTNRIELAEKDMLSLINGSPAASALVADAALAARNRIEVVADVFALAAEAFNAPLGHFAEELEAPVEQPTRCLGLERLAHPHRRWPWRRAPSLSGAGEHPHHAAHAG